MHIVSPVHRAPGLEVAGGSAAGTTTGRRDHVLVPTSDRAIGARHRRARLVVVLAVTSGATDAIGFLALGSAFTSVMTGNMVLLGVGAADRRPAGRRPGPRRDRQLHAPAPRSAPGPPATAHADDPVWPRPVTTALTVELVLFAVFAAWWWAPGSAPDAAVRSLPLLALNAAALGMQSSAIQRFGVSGLSTTYLTGTLTTVVIRLTQRKGLRTVGHSLRDPRRPRRGRRARHRAAGASRPSPYRCCSW